MELTREKALELHLQMWSDMQDEYGDNPDAEEREGFKIDWCKRKFPGVHIRHNCFLCEFAERCKFCPIDWRKLKRDEADPSKCCAVYAGEILDPDNPEIYLAAPISEILAMPEREDI